MSINIDDVMTGLGVRLQTISGLRVYAFPADSINIPAAIVAYPESVDYDSTMARGCDTATFSIWVVVGKVSDRSARTALAAYLNGTGNRSIKTAIEADKTLGGAAQSVRVTNAEVSAITIGGIDYLAAEFKTEIVA